METKTEEKTPTLKPKSALKKADAQAKPKKNITYDSILENMGLCVYDDKLTELAKQAEAAEVVTEKSYPHINKNPKNIPQNGYIYNKYNKYLPNHGHKPQGPSPGQRHLQGIPRQQQQQQQQYQLPQQQQQQQQQQQHHQPTVFAPPTTIQTHDRLIRTIVHNILVKKQTPSQPPKTLVLY